jgi:hypothetical protein
LAILNEIRLEIKADVKIAATSPMTLIVVDIPLKFLNMRNLANLLISWMLAQ